MKRSLLTSAALALLVATVGQAKADVIYSLAGDWSDTFNPNGVWSYNYDIGKPITVHQSNWDPVDFGTPQPAWAFGPVPNGNGNTAVAPAWFRSNGTIRSDWDAPVGRVVVNSNDTANGYNGGTTPANVTWTSPIAGRITISGDTWSVFEDMGRSTSWSIQLNGVVLASGVSSDSDNFTSSSPDVFPVLTATVNVGDVVTFEAATTSQFSMQEGVDLMIDASPVPEPAALTLFGIGTLGLLWCARRRRKTKPA